MKKIICIIFIFFQAINLSAKQNDNKNRSEYVVDYTKNMTIAPFVAQYGLSFEMQAKDDDDEIVYEPNSYGNYGVSFSYLGFGVAI